MPAERWMQRTWMSICGDAMDGKEPPRERRAYSLRYDVAFDILFINISISECAVISEKVGTPYHISPI